MNVTRMSVFLILLMANSILSRPTVDLCTLLKVQREDSTVIGDEASKLNI